MTDEEKRLQAIERDRQATARAISQGQIDTSTPEGRYVALENEKRQAINEADATYNDLMNNSNAYTQQYNDYLNQYQTTQSGIYDKQLQREQEKADLAKKQAEEEFNKEAIASKNAYYDFINPYGVQRELQVQQGLGNSGYSETVKSQAWNAQQNRTAQARATMNQAKLQFDEDMKDARLNNDVLKAQLALDTLKMKQDETLRNFNYKSDMMQTRLANSQALNSEYNNRYNTLWNQINTENQQKEAIRQYEKNFAENQRQYNQNYELEKNQNAEKMAYQRERDKVADSQWEREYALSRQKVNNSGGGYYGSLTDSSGFSLGNSGFSLDNNGKAVNPYTGTRNKDADEEWGTFSNGYQPKGISGYGKLTKTDDTITFNTVKPDGTPMVSTQSIWKTPKGELWYWDGRDNQYHRFYGERTNRASGGGGKGSRGSGGGGGFGSR